MSFAQDKLKKMPGYERYSQIAPKIRNSVKLVPRIYNWDVNSASFEYNFNGKRLKFDVTSGKTTEVEDHVQTNRRYNYSNRPQRGRQYASSNSPDGQYKAYTKNRNMYISSVDGSNEIAITTDGNEDTQKKYGIATWVYGEELGQITAMWWSPDSKKIAFYRFEEKDADMYYVLYDQVKIQDSVEVEAYPKVGADNLPVDVMVYDLDTKQLTLLDTRNGKPYDDGALGTYLYGMDWTPDGKEFLFHTTNRKQDVMEYKAADPTTGKTRTIVQEKWLPSFTKNTPELQVLNDGQHFIWASERNGFNNYYLYNWDGTLLNSITNHNFEVNRILKIDEADRLLYYEARSGNNHMKMQLHRVNFNGTNDIRLTDPAYHHDVTISPNGEFFVDVSQTHNIVPFTTLINAQGTKVAEILESDKSTFETLGLNTVEVFKFTSADGVTELHGMLHFPSNFDPNKRYPLILANYGGPATNAFRETFTMPNPLTEYGFLIANIDGRNVKGRGKELLDQLYGNLCIVEMDDFAEGIKSLYDRPYFDKDHVGVYGTSYGGTTAAASLLRFPNTYHAAVANSAVTDWRNYDTIYTERFMNLITNNKIGYDASNLMNYAKDLQGELMIYFGTSDNNVHPSNSLQLIKALQNAGKSFEVQVGPDRGHTAMNRERMMEFFIEHLVLDNNNRGVR
ncbi:MAG: prolyl oligopeptidase family serine peptidase [Bacteroidetes bacterium]|nr:prolyl oligopeptidase family serine peptidase [Bacteroidota bacterium]